VVRYEWLLNLVDGTPVEVEWETPLTRFKAFTPWFVSGILVEWFNTRPGGPIRGKWRILGGTEDEWSDLKFRAPRW
jgi:hypothetical protein